MNSMTWKKLSPEDYVVSRWSGGTTTQVAIAPEGAVYADRYFLWRVSSASVELEESEFTPLPDYWRWISTLEGEMRLSHNGALPVLLAPYEVHQFDGGAATRSWGRCTDYNLMLRKGEARGLLRPVRLAAGDSTEIAFESAESSAFPQATLLLFCGAGTVAVTIAGEEVRLEERTSLLVRDAARCRLQALALEDAALLIAEMQTR